MKKENKPIKDFMGIFPKSYNEDCIKSFAVYAIRTIREGKEFEGGLMYKKGMPETMVEDYRFAFECIKAVLSLLGQ